MPSGRKGHPLPRHGISVCMWQITLTFVEIHRLPFLAAEETLGQSHITNSLFGQPEGWNNRIPHGEREQERALPGGCTILPIKSFCSTKCHPCDQLDISKVWKHKPSHVHLSHHFTPKLTPQILHVKKILNARTEPHHCLSYFTGVEQVYLTYNLICFVFYSLGGKGSN